jgi:hypothetical protein
VDKGGGSYVNTRAQQHFCPNDTLEPTARSEHAFVRTMFVRMGLAIGRVNENVCPTIIFRLCGLFCIECAVLPAHYILEHARNLRAHAHPVFELANGPRANHGVTTFAALPPALVGTPRRTEAHMGAPNEHSEID